MKWFVAVLVFLNVSANAEIIQSSNRVDWVVGTTVGPQTEIPVRNNLLDVTASPYNADNTGVMDAATAIQAAIDAAASNDVVYLPAGNYLIGGAHNLTINKSYITLRGTGTNTVLWGLTSSAYVLSVGHDALSADPNRVYTVTNGATKGSTNLVLNSVQNGYGDTIKAGDMLSLSTVTRNTGSDALPIISVANYDRILKQTVVILSRSGSTVSITAPLVWDLTNSPKLVELDTLSQPRRSVSIENLSITLTNNGSSGSSGFMISGSCLRDCVFTNLDLGFANNYQLYIPNSVNCLVTRCVIHDPLSTGTSHSGMLMAADTGILIQDNIFTSVPARGITLFPAIEVNDGCLGNAFVGNYFTNNSTDIDMHNTHPMMNLFEGNVFNAFFEMDGYFGSSSHFTLFRNRLIATIPLKRFTSNMQIVGNVIGTTNFSYVYEKEEASYGSPYPLFEMGYPNIGNSGYSGTNPPIAWNYPGKTLTAFTTETLTNGVFTFTGNYGPTNVLWTNMGTGTFTNIPTPINAGYALVFQDSNNTNIYYGETNGSVLVSTVAGTASNLTLGSWVYVSNGFTLFMAGQNAYQQLQQSNKFTHTIHGNVLYTNSTGTLIWSSGIADHNMAKSLIYTNGAPSWWGTNRWPAIDPTNSPLVMTIPAEDRFKGIQSSGGGSTPAAFAIGKSTIGKSFTSQ